MSKANISFPEGMLEEVDRRAEAAGITRSGFIQETTVLHDDVAILTVEGLELRAERRVHSLT